MKVYIAVLNEFPDYMIPTLVAHSILSAHLNNKDNIEWIEWLTTSYKKVVVRVNKKEFDKISKIEGVYLGHENNTLNSMKSCAVLLCDNKNIPNVLKFAKLWKPENG